MNEKKSVFDKQLEARVEWEKYKITGDPEHGEIALSSAESSGYANEGKSVFLKNVPELSNAYNEGVSDNAADYSIEKKLERESNDHLDKYGPMIPPTAGKTYEGPIVYGDENHLYQASKIQHNEVLIKHERNSLGSSESNTLERSGDSVSVRYVSDKLAIASPMKEMEGPETPQLDRER